jgi:hypothetical protein
MRYDLWTEKEEDVPLTYLADQLRVEVEDIVENLIACARHCYEAEIKE